jgi:hypothetical protein
VRVRNTRTNKKEVTDARRDGSKAVLVWIRLEPSKKEGFLLRRGVFSLDSPFNG